MGVSTILESLSDLFNSAFGFVLIWAALVWVFIWLSSKFNPFQEKWKEWEGSIITGIKLAEKDYVELDVMLSCRGDPVLNRMVCRRFVR